MTNGKVSAVAKEIDLLTKTVTTVTSLPTPRVGLGLVEQINNSSSGASNHLYAIGGFDGHGHPLNTVEVYDFATKVWSQAAPMEWFMRSVGPMVSNR